MPQSTVIIKPVAGFPGMEPTSEQGQNVKTRLSGETTLQLPFGAAVSQVTTDDRLCVSFDGTKPLIGLVVYSAAYQIAHELSNVADSNGNIGLVPGATVGVKTRGSLWVQIDEDVDPTKHVRVRNNNTGAAVGPGCFRASAVSTHTWDLSAFAKWSGTYPASGKVALLEFDFTMAGFGAGTADS